MLENFKEEKHVPIERSVSWEEVTLEGEPLPVIFCSDGSLSQIQYEKPPYKAIIFVKTALIGFDKEDIKLINKEFPHPFDLRDLIINNSFTYPAVFPLRHVKIEGMSLFDAVRKCIFNFMREGLNGEIMETLKWLLYEKWRNITGKVLNFECPHCEEKVQLWYDNEKVECSNCRNELFITDVLGFHRDMTEGSASERVANAYMNIHEVLLLFTGIKYYWEKKRDFLSKCLFVKDGPLFFRAQYARLVKPIRKFFEYTKKINQEIYLVSQEKRGQLVDYLELIGNGMSGPRIFIPNNKYIREEIQGRPDRGNPYGVTTNYGAKIFLIVNEHHKMVLNIPTGYYKENPQLKDLIGVQKIFETIPFILSNSHKGGLVPIERAHNVASLSTYPTKRILKLFADMILKVGNK
ncbi:MAG: hypothetical protein ACTSPY_05380 [Candidatus Helarchaeota archaeon]